MNQATWRQLSQKFLDEAKALLDASQWGGAYYLAGYALECALKACVLDRVVSDPGLLFVSQNQGFQKKIATRLEGRFQGDRRPVEADRLPGIHRHGHRPISERLRWPRPVRPRQDDSTRI